MGNNFRKNMSIESLNSILYLEMDMPSLAVSFNFESHSFLYLFDLIDFYPLKNQPRFLQSWS